jgi:hypothetical protein
MRAETTHQLKGKARGPSEKPFEAVAPKEPVYVLLGCINKTARGYGERSEEGCSGPMASYQSRLRFICRNSVRWAGSSVKSAERAALNDLTPR